ncbi:guanine nucleotide exchange factor [Anaeramoeba flamelloides]|nr:guanine nucleotide exchange factor [Anaeramoeba flamelloides]
MLDRIDPVQRSITFSKIYGSTKNEITHALSKDDILQLIMQYFNSLGRRDIISYIEENSSQLYCIPRLGENRLLKILNTNLSETEKIWDQIIINKNENKQDIQKKIEKVEYLSKDLGLRFKIQNDVNVWDEPKDNPNNILFYCETFKEQKDSYKQKQFLDILIAANFNKLIERLTWEVSTDQDYIKAFLMTYHSFTKAEHVFEKLIQRYHLPPKLIQNSFNNKDARKKNSLFQLRVLTVLNTWIKSDEEFDPMILSDLAAFVDNQVYSSYPTFAKKIQQTIINKKKRITLRSEAVFKTNPPEIRIPKNLFSHKVTLDNLDEIEFARQLTIFFHENFKKIRPKDLISGAWNKVNNQSKEKNVFKILQKFNQIERYFATQIVMPKLLKNRVAVLNRILKINEQLYQLNNFYSIASIYYALSSTSVKRLKITKSELSKNLNSNENIFEIIKESNNYSKYHQYISTIQPPIVPHIKIYLKDLKQIVKKNSDTINGLINFSKRRLIFRKIEQFCYYQQESYNLLKIHQIQKILNQNLPAKSDEKLFYISLKREPRNSKKSEIL